METRKHAQMKPTKTIKPENLELLTKIGEGSQGTVYVAEDSERNQYAVKVEEAGGRLLQGEYRIYQELERQGISEGVPRVYGFFDGKGEEPNRLVMELLGDNLETCVKRDGPFSPQLALALTRSALRILRNLHFSGIIHMDVALRNIMFSKRVDNTPERDSEDDADSDKCEKGDGSSEPGAEKEVDGEKEGGLRTKTAPGGGVQDKSRPGEERSEGSEKGDSTAHPSDVETEKVVFVDFAFSSVHGRDKDQNGNPPTLSDCPTFLLLAKQDVEYLVECTEDLVRKPKMQSKPDTSVSDENPVEKPETDEPSVLPEIDCLKTYLESIEVDAPVDYDKMLAILK